MVRRVFEMLLLLFILTAALSAAPSPMELYQKALVQERGAGNLREAIALYERAAKEAGRDRELAAKALVRAAGCYEKLGEPKAAQLYAEVARTYPEQRESVAAAQVALMSVTRGKTAPGQISATLSGQLSAAVVPLLDNYCMNCHNPTRKIGGLALDGIRDHLSSSAQSLASDAEILEKVLSRLRSRTMPPAGRPHPDVSTNQNAIALLERALDSGYPQPVLPGDRADDTEIASRMAKLIWNSEPDTVLLDAATRGRLSDSGVLQQQVRRMLADPKSENLALHFFDPWLHLSDLTKVPLTPLSPPELDDQLRQAMRRETQLFIESQVREDHPAMDLWTSNYSFVNDRLAQYYGIPNISGGQFRRVTRPGNDRSGLLGQGSILTLTSIYVPRSGHPRTSPTMRGKWFYGTFFGLSVPPPPPSVSPLNDEGNPSISIRKLVEAHHANPNCSNCHQIFEPFGMALENFDAIGRLRDQDRSEPVETSGSFADGSAWSDTAQFKQGLGQYRESFATNVTEVLLSYALGRTRQYNDGTSTPSRLLHANEMPAVRVILRDAAAGNYTWSALIAGIIKSQPFQMKAVVP